MNFRRLGKDEIIWMATHRCKHGHTFLEHPQCHQLNRVESLAFLDIEASNLSADFGIMLSYAIKPLNDPKILGDVIKPSDLKSSKILDKNLVAACIKDMKKFDRLIGYYSSRYDIPFIRTRSMLHGLDFPVYREVKHTDVFYWVRSKMCLHRRRLQTVCDFLGIPAKTHPLAPPVWTTALTGDKKALKYILDHNREDVISLEEVYKRLVDFTADRSATV